LDTQMATRKPSPLLLAFIAFMVAALFDLGCQVTPPDSVMTAAQFPEGAMGTVGDKEEYPVGNSGATPTCPGFTLASGILTQTPHGATEGHFEVGEGFAGMMRPANPAYHHIGLYSTLSSGLQRNVAVVICMIVVEPRQLKVIKK
jgi:hypothetical protein